MKKQLMAFGMALSMLFGAASADSPGRRPQVRNPPARSTGGR